MKAIKRDDCNLLAQLNGLHPELDAFAKIMENFRQNFLDGRDLTATRIHKSGHRTHGAVPDNGKLFFGGIDWRTFDLGVVDSVAWNQNRDAWKAFGFVLRDTMNAALPEDSLYVLAFDPHDDYETKFVEQGKPRWHNQHFHAHMKPRERDTHARENETRIDAVNP